MRILLFVFATLILVFATWASAGEETAQTAKKEKTRVGIFDSRAVAVAYASSKHIDVQYKKLKKDHDDAKAAGDKEKAARLEAEGKAGQERLHQQGFGTASVKKYLDAVKDKIPEVAKRANVDLIVSKWEVAYRADDLETVDVTDAIVKLFEPNERALKSIEGLKSHAPLDEDEIRNIKD
jgi:Skp family chaperone for outer membrane proteins